jgi:hypothetical protein
LRLRGLLKAFWGPYIYNKYYYLHNKYE